MDQPNQQQPGKEGMPNQPRDKQSGQQQETQQGSKQGNAPGQTSHQGGQPPSDKR